MMKTASRILGPFLLLSVIVLSLACRSGSSDQRIKQKIAGLWEEVKGTKETLQFNADGTLLMKSRAENRSCEYSFPDSGHIRLDCTMVAGGPRTSQTFKFSMTSDRVMISDEVETGTYKRVEDPTPAAGTQ
jgi:hypothetical protein